MGWDGMGWDGMGWDGMGWDGMGWDGMGWDGMGWGMQVHANTREFIARLSVETPPGSALPLLSVCHTSQGVIGSLFLNGLLQLGHSHCVLMHYRGCFSRSL